MTASIIESVYREERGRILASLIRWSRSLDDAEEVLQDAFATATDRWAREGVPQNPGAWILTAARHRLMDRRRIEIRRRELLSQHHPIELIVDNHDPEELPDDILRLFFTCCHPVLSPEAQIALTLRTLGGLSTPEIARAFLLPESNIAQRIVRAKAKILAAGVPYRLPLREDLPLRIDSVLGAIYLIFNEGYSASSGDSLIRVGLCQEAIRLAALLNTWLPTQAELEGLLALMILTHARRDARTNAQGELITLDEQQRSQWHSGEITSGLALVEQALVRRTLGPYQLQAAIAAVHAEAATANATDWLQIASLYCELLRFDSSGVVRLNHAIAVGYANGWELGLELLEAIPDLTQYHPWHAVHAQMLKRVGRAAQARIAFEQAMRLCANRAECEYLSRQLASLDV